MAAAGRKEGKTQGKRRAGNPVSVTVGGFLEGLKVYRLVCLPTMLGIDMSMFLPFVFTTIVTEGWGGGGGGGGGGVKNLVVCGQSAVLEGPADRQSSCREM